MNVRVQVPVTLKNFLDVLNPAGRARLFSAAAASLHDLVQRHLLSIEPKHHIWAGKLGAKPTGHIGKGIGGLSSSYSENSASVTIPIAGIGRAFRPITITPVAAKALTIPIHAMAYGSRVATLQRHGWTIFRPKGSDVLMGKQKKSKDAPVALYALKKSVTQKQDRSLLPSDAVIGQVVSSAMTATISRASKAS